MVTNGTFAELIFLESGREFFGVAREKRARRLLQEFATTLEIGELG